MMRPRDDNAYENIIDPEIRDFILNNADWNENDTIHEILPIIKIGEDGGKQIQVCKLYNDKKLERRIKGGFYISNCLLKSNWYLRTGYTCFRENSLNFLRFKDLKFIFKSLRDKFNIFINPHDEIYLDLFSLGAISSYFRETFHIFPYFDFYSAERECGKTKSAKCVLYSSFRGFGAGYMTRAALMRTIEAENNTIFIDEIDQIVKKDNPELFQILNTGFQKGIPCLIIDENNEPKKYDTFGFKIITRVGDILGDLKSRCISFLCVQNAGRKKIIDRHPWPEDFESERNLLYLYRLKYHLQVKTVYENIMLYEKRIGDRNKDLWSPLLTIAKLLDVKLYDNVLNYAKIYDEKNKSITHSWINVVITQTLIENNVTGKFLLKDFTKAFNEMAEEKGYIDGKKPFRSQSLVKKFTKLPIHKSKYKKNNQTYYEISKQDLNHLISIYLEDQEEIPLIDKEPTRLEKLLSQQEFNEDLLAQLKFFLEPPKQKIELIKKFGEIYGRKEVKRTIKHLFKDGKIYEFKEGWYQLL